MLSKISGNSGKLSVMLAVVTALLIAGGVFAFVVRREASPQESLLTQVRQDGSRYVDPSGFSFVVPDGYSTRVLQDGEARAIVVEREGSGFQVSVSPYDEPVAEFGVARIKKDLPDIEMSEVRELSVSGGKGISFESDGVREIWFAADGSLYQITASRSEAAHAERVAETFRAR